MLPGKIHRIISGAFNPAPEIASIAEFGSLAVLDGGQALGMVAGAVAMEAAIGRARAGGIGWVSIRNSNHFGAAGSYVMMAIDEGMVGFCFSNCGPIMAVYGTQSRCIGNNPMAIGAPGKSFPVVLDMALSISSFGRIGTMKRLGQEVPDDWYAVPPEPGKDAVLRAMGGPKGSGLAIMVEVLTSVMAGGAIPWDMRPFKGNGKNDGTTHTMIAVDVRRMVPEEEYEETMMQLVTQLKSAERVEGVDDVRIPGEYEWQSTMKLRAEGIPLDDEVVRSLNNVAQEIGTEVPWS
jgi:LDH2 family malate/lactate/ureidoglycolate dehydrogenase